MTTSDLQASLPHIHPSRALVAAGIAAACVGIMTLAFLSSRATSGQADHPAAPVAAIAAPGVRAVSEAFATSTQARPQTIGAAGSAQRVDGAPWYELGSSPGS